MLRQAEAGRQALTTCNVWQAEVDDAITRLVLAFPGIDVVERIPSVIRQAYPSAAVDALWVLRAWSDLTYLASMSGP